MQNYIEVGFVVIVLRVQSLPTYDSVSHEYIMNPQRFLARAMYFYPMIFVYIMNANN